MKKIEHIENRSIFIDVEIGLSKKIDKKKRENKPEHQLSIFLATEQQTHHNRCSLEMKLQGRDWMDGKRRLAMCVYRW